MTAAIIETDGRSIVLDLSTGATLCGASIAGLDVNTLSERIDRSMAETFVDMYVNKWTIDVGDEGQAALGTFFSETSRLGILDAVGALDVIGLEA